MSSTLGIVAEYNPFHNGHKYHLEQSKIDTGADNVVAIISGNFTQRGEPAILNKWDRAKLALENGADLVLELPTVYSVSSAENFATGAIKTLDTLRFIEYVSFGSEEKIDILEKVADTLLENDKDFSDLLHKKLDEGISYPSALSSSLSERLNLDLEATLKGSNNILAIEYLKALKTIKTAMKPISILREGSSHSRSEIKGKFCFISQSHLKNLFTSSYPLYSQSSSHKLLLLLV